MQQDPDAWTSVADLEEPQGGRCYAPEMTSDTSRLQRTALSILFVAWLGAAGLVIGFCAGGFFGPPLFGSKGGHGLGDIGYLFEGAFLGAILGMLAGVYGVRSWPPKRQSRAALWAGGAAAIVVGTTWVIVNFFGGW